MNWSDLRVAIVGPLPPPAGGMANQTRQLAELLQGEGAYVDVVQVNPPYKPTWVANLKGLRAVFRLIPYFFRLWNATGRANLVHVMANSGWSWHLFAAPAVWVASLRGVPVVVNYRGGEADRFLSKHASIVRATMRRASSLVLPSGFLLEVFACHGMRGRVVPNIVNVERFQPDAEHSLDPSAPHLVVARNLEHIYGNDIALKAFAKVLEVIPGARLSIAGSGPELASLTALAEQLGVSERVSFTGRLDRDEMAALYRQADVMLNPTRVDNMPNSVLEALASGLPVVATSVGGVPFIVEHEKTALLVPAEDEDALASETLRLLRDPELRVRLSRAGVASAREYRWSDVRTKLADVYQAASMQELIRGAA
ncbi:MAG TPA: glycosyltransferase family 4 protein [Azoarcus taiwanensis]|nr:glycosyltransferase family 4 protein [Azoarcus taiwanensis]